MGLEANRGQMASLSAAPPPHSALTDLLGWSSFFAPTPHTHPIPVFPFHFLIFCFSFWPENFFVPDGRGEGGLGRDSGGCTGGGRHAPCSPVSCDITVVELHVFRHVTS